MNRNKSSQSKATASIKTEDSGRYIDGLHARKHTEFYAVAPGVVRPYQNPWTARVVRNSRLPKTEKQEKTRSALTKTADRIMAVATAHKLSPYKQDIRQQSRHLTSTQKRAWRKRAESIGIVAAGGLIGVVLRSIDWVRQLATRGRRQLTETTRTQQKDYISFVVIAAIALAASIGLIGSHFVATNTSFTPVEPIGVQPDPTPVFPVDPTSNTNDSQDEDNTQISAEDVSRADCDSTKTEHRNSSSDSAGTNVETNEATGSQSATEETTNEESATTPRTTDNTGDTSTSTQTTTHESTSDSESTNETDSTASTDGTESQPEEEMVQQEQDAVTCLTEQTQETLSEPLLLLDPRNEICID